MLLHLFQIPGGSFRNHILKHTFKTYPVLQLPSLGARGEVSSDVSTINIYLISPS